MKTVKLSQVGATLTENIVESIDQSRKFLIILSPGYVSSSWCMFEAHLAHHRLIQVTLFHSITLAIILGHLPSVEDDNG